MKTDVKDYEELLSANTEELFAIIKRDFYNPDLPKALGLKKGYNIMSQLSNRLKIKFDNEQQVFLMCNLPRVACCATAGSGKTTTANFNVIRATKCLGLDPDKIIILAYNKDAVASFQSRLDNIRREMDKYVNQLRTVAYLKSLGAPTPKDLPILTEEQINSIEELICVPSNYHINTFHSFCLNWVSDYRSLCGSFNGKIKLLAEWEELDMLEEQMNLLVQEVQKTEGRFIQTHPKLSSALLQLYNYASETLTLYSGEGWEKCGDYSDLSMFSQEELKRIFLNFQKKQLSVGKVNFVTILSLFNVLLDRPEIVDRIRYVYKYFVIDEYQDFTPLMVSIVKKIFNGSENISPFMDGYLVCIGDDDQSIYGFKGTNSRNFISFKEDFSAGIGIENTRLLSMSYNRRCPEKILNVARKIAEDIPDRIEKPTLGIHEGGTITVHEYKDTLSEINDIISKLDKKNLTNTCICYRNVASSNMLTLRLMEEGIPFKPSANSSIKPLSDGISKTFLGVMEMLYDWENTELLKEHFFKVVPTSPRYSKRYFENVFDKFIKYREERLQKTDEHDSEFIPLKSFMEFDWSEVCKEMSEFRDNLYRLKLFHDKLKSGEPMSAYVPQLLALIFKYYLKRLLQGPWANRFSTEFIDYISQYFAQEKRYKVFRVELNEKIQALKESENAGVFITTFHGLKGLEYEKVFAMDLDDNIFPGPAGDKMSPEQKLEKKKDDLKLLFVLVTRSKSDLQLWFNCNSPSSFMSYFMDDSKDLIFEETDSSVHNQQYEFLLNLTSEYIFCDELTIQEPELEIDMDELFDLDVKEETMSIKRSDMLDKQKLNNIVNSVQAEVGVSVAEQESTNLFSDDMSFDFDEVEEIPEEPKPNLEEMISIIKEKL